LRRALRPYAGVGRGTVDRSGIPQLPPAAGDGILGKQPVLAGLAEEDAAVAAVDGPLAEVVEPGLGAWERRGGDEQGWLPGEGGVGEEAAPVLACEGGEHEARSASRVAIWTCCFTWSDTT
jgi:hypothetical protein